MSNPISGIFSGSPTLDKVALEKAKRKALDRPFDGQSDPAKAEQARVAVTRDDELVLSPIAKQAMAEPAFDRSKVEAIKQAIIDMVRHERKGDAAGSLLGIEETQEQFEARANRRCARKVLPLLDIIVRQIGRAHV